MKHYHASLQRLRGSTVHPGGYYERVEGSGCPEAIYGFGYYAGFPISKVGESCFSKSIAGAVAAVAPMCREGEKCEAHVYETEEDPDVDISDCAQGDFATLEEVRYRRPVKVRYRRKVVIPQEALIRFRKAAQRLEDADAINPDTWDSLMVRLKRGVKKRL